MGGRFDERMASSTDAELVALVSGPADDWQPEAIESAREELARRGLSAERTEGLTAEFKKSEAAAVEGLDLTTKLSIAIFAGTCVPGLVVLYLYTQYEKRGQRRKAKEALSWFVYGVATYFVALVLFIVIHGK
jgi:hypothetical protein